MSDYKRTNHTEWDCKYHIIFIPKYRKKVLYGKLRDRLGGVFRRLAHQKESEVEEGHLRVDHVHMMLSIPPKYSVATVVGFLKGKSAIWIARHFGEATRGFIGKNFWARGYFVSTVGRDEEVIRNYIQRQEMEDRRIDTGLAKLGAILGDDVEIGCNAVTSPGALLGPGTWVYANVTVRKGIYPARSLLRPPGGPAALESRPPEDRE